MPEKNYGRNSMRDGTSCLRCWRNKLKHGSKEAKAFVIKNGLSLNFDVNGERDKDIQHDEWIAKNARRESKELKFAERREKQMEKKQQKLDE
jgi:hypothetical protein